MELNSAKLQRLLLLLLSLKPWNNLQVITPNMLNKASHNSKNQQKSSETEVFP